MKFLYAATLSAVAIFCMATVSHAQAPTNPYAAKCQMCHGATGLGDTPAGKMMGARAFNAPDVIKQSDSDLLTVIKSGKGKMPAFAGKLTDPEMTALVAYIRKLQ
ncbi:c-type cytochrome [Terriglobus saanensis]|uniref:Cytochrome c class I n=1 Tax=Terriglobus saanensis (strain ATCC BAA-1853 / DSM 23119 / SP1PR4) TaxID=401053 RepID=E8UYF1_TERSS|nr:cytochrome c [Terriglobus saanensis]ADV82039.1 cytochrome c class I [Terriglobus saanensis SP1PR4]